MALMADDGYARAIFPSHTMGDGDTVFSLATGSWDGQADVSHHRRAGRRRDGEGARAGGDTGDRPARHSRRPRPEKMSLRLALLLATPPAW